MKLRIHMTLLVLTLVVGAQGLYADPIIIKAYDSAGNSLIIYDNNTSASSGTGTYSFMGLGDLSSKFGYLVFLGDVGAWDVQTNIGRGYPNVAEGIMDLNFNVQHTGPTSTSLTLELTQTGLSTDYDGWRMNIGGTMEENMTVSYTAYADDGNTAFGTAPSMLISTTGPFTPFAFSDSSGGAVSVNGLYSLTQRVTISGGSAGAFATGDAQLTPAPEPTTLVLMGSGLVGLALARRRKNKATPAQV